MPHPEFFLTPGYGERQLRMFHYSQAVKIGNRVETSGQGGWNDDWQFPPSLADEIAQAFRNVERTLAAAGARWEHVIAVNSYHLGFPQEVNQIMTERFQDYMPNHAPIWTALGVPLETRRCGSRSGLRRFFRNNIPISCTTPSAQVSILRPGLAPERRTSAQPTLEFTILYKLDSHKSGPLESSSCGGETGFIPEARTSAMWIN